MDHVQQINDTAVKEHPIYFKENLTASSVHRCNRNMWLTLRNCSIITPKAERIRAMKLGQSVEHMIYEWLEQSGYKISHKQSKLTNKFGNTIAKIDGIVMIDKKYRLLSIKTCGSKHWKDWMKGKNLDFEKRQVHIEMFHSSQLSQRGAMLDSVFFVVFNRDNCEIHTEVMEYDKQCAEFTVNSMIGVIESEALPQADESFDCEWCDQRGVCRGETVSQINCRTCAHVSVENGEFRCQHGYGRICNRYVFHPQLIELLGYEFKEVDHENEALIFDKMAIAGEGVKVPGLPTFTSEEFVLAHPAGLVHDEFILGVKALCDGVIDKVE